MTSDNWDIIKENDYVLFKMPSGSLRLHQIRQNKVSLGKFGAFEASEMIGKFFNVVHEIYDQGKVRLATKQSMLEDIEIESNENANNQNLVDDVSAQKLSFEEIEKLKKEKEGTEMVKSLLENSKTFDQKTDFAKAKYIKRKEKKYGKTFLPLRPDAVNMTEYYTSTSHHRIMFLRIDTLSQMMTFANIHSESRVMVLDDACGLVLAAVMERMHGLGDLLAIHNGDNHRHSAFQYMNFPKSAFEHVHRVSWQALETDDIPEKTEEVNTRLEHLIQAKTMWKEGGFDGLIAAVEENPMTILTRCASRLAPGRPVVFYSPYKETLLEAFMHMRHSVQYINVQLTESWMREYQVPLHMVGMHPHMSTSGSGGFLLTGIAVAAEEHIIPRGKDHDRKKKRQ